MDRHSYERREQLNTRPAHVRELMKPLTPLLLLLLPVAVQAGDAFGDRVQRAKAVEETPAGQEYQDAMWPMVKPFVAALMQSCCRRHADCPQHASA